MKPFPLQDDLYIYLPINFNKNYTLNVNPMVSWTCQWQWLGRPIRYQRRGRRMPWARPSHTAPALPRGSTRYQRRIRRSFFKTILSHVHSFYEKTIDNLSYLLPDCKGRDMFFIVSHGLSYIYQTILGLRRYFSKWYWLCYFDGTTPDSMWDGHNNQCGSTRHWTFKSLHVLKLLYGYEVFHGKTNNLFTKTWYLKTRMQEISRSQNSDCR